MDIKRVSCVAMLCLTQTMIGCISHFTKLKITDCYSGYSEKECCLHGIIFWDPFCGIGYIPVEFFVLIDDVNPDKESPMDPRPSAIIYAYEVNAIPARLTYLETIKESPIAMAEIWMKGSLNSLNNPLMYGGYAKINKVYRLKPINEDEYNALYEKYVSEMRRKSSEE